MTIRTIPASLVAVFIVATTVTLSSHLAAAQQGSPTPGDSIGPIVWQLTELVDAAHGSTLVDDPARYTIQLRPNGLASIVADCNVGSGPYVLVGNSLEFGPVTATRVACEPGSLSDRFLSDLSFVRSFTIDQTRATDRLVLSLMADGGSLHFSPSLVGVVWEWQQFEGGDGSVIAPEEPSRYALEFFSDGMISGRVDCNQAVGGYDADGSSISMMLGTAGMPCSEDSLDAEFLRLTSESNTYVIRDGKLALFLPMDGGTTTFTPRFVDPAEASTPEAGG